MKGKALIVLCIFSSLLCGVVCAAWISGSKVQTDIEWDKELEGYSISVMRGGFLILHAVDSHEGKGSWLGLKVAFLEPHDVLDPDTYPSYLTEPKTPTWRFAGLLYSNKAVDDVIVSVRSLNRISRIQYVYTPFGMPFALLIVLPAAVVVGPLTKAVRSNKRRRAFVRFIKLTCLLLLLPLVCGGLLTVGIVRVLPWVSWRMAGL